MLHRKKPQENYQAPAMKGIYDEWHKVAIHIQGKSGIVHKMYDNLDEAKASLADSNNSYKEKLKAPKAEKSSKGASTPPATGPKRKWE